MTDTALDFVPELNALKKFFTDAHASIDKGTIVNMAGIDTRIANVCSGIQKASPANQEKYLPELTSLIDLLNQYEQALRTFQVVQLAEAAKYVSHDKSST